MVYPKFGPPAIVYPISSIWLAKGARIEGIQNWGQRGARNGKEPKMDVDGDLLREEQRTTERKHYTTFQICPQP